MKIILMQPLLHGSGFTKKPIIRIWNVILICMIASLDCFRLASCFNPQTVELSLDFPCYYSFHYAPVLPANMPAMNITGAACSCWRGNIFIKTKDFITLKRATKDAKRP